MKDKSLENKAIDFKGKKYVLVSDRVLYFNETYPDGCITTEMISKGGDDMVIFKASIFPLGINTDPMGQPQGKVFTGYSQAKWGDGYINKTSAIENAETSAVGRALAFMGIGVIDSIASVDEINKAENQSKQPYAPSFPQMTPEEAFVKAKNMIDEAENLDQLQEIQNKLNYSKFIPDRRSTKGKEMRDDLDRLIYEKSQKLIASGEVPFNDGIPA